MHPDQRFFLIIAAALGALAVALGAFGAHGLKSLVSADMLLVWETGVRYHLAHTLALLACTIATPLWHSPWMRIASWVWIGGIAIFSGSLYALVLSDFRILGAITPLGGIMLIVGWVALGVAGYKSKPTQ